MGFYQLGVDIELWDMNPKRGARSTFGGLCGVKFPKFPTVFPKIAFKGFFTSSCEKKTQKFFTQKISYHKKIFFKLDLRFLFHTIFVSTTQKPWHPKKKRFMSIFNEFKSEIECVVTFFQVK